MGTLTLVTPRTSAEVFVGSSYVGRSPMTPTLPAGLRTIRLVPDGAHAAVEHTVTLESARRPGTPCDESRPPRIRRVFEDFRGSSVEFSTGFHTTNLVVHFEPRP